MEYYYNSSPPNDHDRPDKTIRTPEQQLIITINSNESSSEDDPDKWLPITESTKGNLVSVVFHLVCSGIGFQALSLPVAFAFLGWKWGVMCLIMAFTWQLYTKWLLIQLSEPFPGLRHSRYLHLAIAAFGPKLGKLLAIFPVMYLSGGSCAMLIITTSGYIKTLFTIIKSNQVQDSSSLHLHGVIWFLIFTCLAISISQLPNLNSIALVSMVGAITAVGSSTLIWSLSIKNGRPDDYKVDYDQPMEVDLFGDVVNAVGIVFLGFRGHNLVLEIQGTLPMDESRSSSKTMWRGVIIASLIIAFTIFPLAICGFWAYGNKISTYGGLLNAFRQVHGTNTSRLVLGTIYLLAILNGLTSFPIYAMPVFDNLEFKYILVKKRQCSKRIRVGLRLFFGGLVLFIVTAFPFLGKLGPLIGGLTLPLTLAYPCFMYVLIRKLDRNSLMWWVNVVLGCLGMFFSVVLVGAAVWNLTRNGLRANFFRP